MLRLLLLLLKAYFAFVMNYVMAKKGLGQHFLTDDNIARKITGAVKAGKDQAVLEVGPGMGVLTSHLIERGYNDLKVVEIDREAIEFLRNKYEKLSIIEGSFLDLQLEKYYNSEISIIGNFPYNISSQIMFRVLYYRDTINEVTGMLQKEVAERICSPPGSKTYGILSVLIQAYYSVEYLFSVPPTVFSPPPKVKSGVIRMERIKTGKPGYNEKLFFSVVKSTFNQRRKIISNSLKPLLDTSAINDELMGKRPEQLGVNDFIRLTGLVERFIKK